MPENKLQEAMLYKPLKDKKVQCRLCNRFCLIKEGERGKCGVRKNVDGKLYTLNYGKTLTMGIDPIEKKPLFHFRPGTSCLGISTYGCNFFCLHCQNWQTTQVREEEAFEKLPTTSPEQIVKATLDEGVEGIAYTYNEPTIFAEYALDTMKLAREKGLYNVWVSNGYMTKECVDAIAPYLDAINIDLKGDARFYKEVCKDVRIEAVKENIKYLHEKKVHVEVTNLIVPGYNDSEENYKEVAEFVHSIDEFMPLHFTRFFPQYKMTDLPPTDVSKLEKAKEVAEKVGVKYVYIGNVAEEEGTRCWKCKNLLVKRIGFSSQIIGLDEKGKCKKCGTDSKIIV